MKFEILNENNEVINTINASIEFVQEVYPNGNYRLIDSNDEPLIQFELVIKRITRLAFLNRFTDAEAIAIDLASIGATPQAAAMRRYQKKVDAATFIDLDRQDTRDGVIALETVGLLAEGRALEILDNPVQEEEKYRGNV